MKSDVGHFACAGCEPVAATFDIHVGKMLTPTFALQGEFWFQTQNLEAGGTASINQAMFLIAGQYWLHPRFWLKAGFGASNLSLTYEDGAGGQSEDLGSGGALEFAAGLELMRTATFGFDMQLKTGYGSYSDRGERVSATSFNLGVNWY